MRSEQSVLGVPIVLSIIGALSALVGIVLWNMEQGETAAR